MRDVENKKASIKFLRQHDSWIKKCVLIKMFNAIDAQDLDTMAEIMHEECLYLNDYEIRNKEDWLEEMQSHFDTKESDLSVEKRIRCETKDCYAAECIANIDGVKSRTTVMASVK